MKLEPEIVATGHGAPMQGNELRKSLHYLSSHFYEMAVPSQGRYVNEAAITNTSGVVYTPLNNINYRSLAIKVLGGNRFNSGSLFIVIKGK